MSQEMDTLQSFYYDSAEETENSVRCYNSQQQEEGICIPYGNIICLLPGNEKTMSHYGLLFIQESPEKPAVQAEESPSQLKYVHLTSVPSSLISRYLYENTPRHFNLTQTPNLSIDIVISTRSGTGLAKSYYQNVLRPLLSSVGLNDYKVHETQTENSILELCHSVFAARAEEGLPQTIIFLSGDGGIVDMIDTFYKTTSESLTPPTLGVIPMGTGNAMASSIGLLKCPAAGLKSLLWGVPHPLPTFTATFSPGAQHITNEGHGRVPVGESTSPGQKPAKIHGGVVASWGMHASLVADSDTSEYRKYGAERFKMAAQELLYPPDGTGTHSYAGTITLTRRDERTKDEDIVTLDRKDHMYAMATMVSRLEKEFLISPESLPLDGRLRFIHFGLRSPEAALKLMSHAYQGGGHVREEGVSYMEIEKLRIDFHETEERWRRVCVDGKIVAVESEGWVEMLITPRTYSASRTSHQELPQGSAGQSRFYSLAGWRVDTADAEEAANMLLIHQAGSVRVGEVVRYTLTYDPTIDTIRPTPSELHVKLKNTSAIPLRAAYLHGPYTLYTSCYPSTFDPDADPSKGDTDGTPQFEPYLKAGGSWDAAITVPTNLHHAAEGASTPVTWRIEIISQVMFSNTATVNFELLVGRDRKSIELVSAGGFSGTGLPPAAQLRDHLLLKSAGEQALVTKGVYSKSITLLVDDTASLWNSPPFPAYHEQRPVGEEESRHDSSTATPPEASERAENATDPLQSNKPKKKVHLVILTHGLHSNLGADMLYLKESIDASVKKAQEHKNSDGTTNEADEEVIVRGFPGNAVRTERGIQYLGKRLAKYVLLMTYPDQPYLPGTNSKSKNIPAYLAPWRGSVKDEPSTEANDSDSHKESQKFDEHAYQITSISFIGHSLGGLVQTYAIAYIQKHSPGFFDTIKPINFIALATPFLGLSNENPMYVKFALDLGLVGRTGQDLGLSWTAPRMRSGWETLIGGKGDPMKSSQRYPDVGSKPLLRILPCGPAQEVLAKFQRRTIYSNVVNDGIVPLRTSCLLFLDWRGLDKVEKSRRGNGLVGTMAEWGWAELTGANSKSPQSIRTAAQLISKNVEEEASGENGSIYVASTRANTPANDAALAGDDPTVDQLQRLNLTGLETRNTAQSSYSPLNSFLSMFKSKETTKVTKIYKRSQTLGPPGATMEASLSSPSFPDESLTRDHLFDEYGLHAPPKTTFFESASDLLLPPLPPTEFITDPTSRPRTIFHDRVYHPDDVPPPPPLKRRARTFSHMSSKTPTSPPTSPEEGRTPSIYGGHESEIGIKVEEKIARAYHRNLSWRKVLVRLEPDAHNNIIVRRMFTNAYGWPVVKHLADNHFGPSSAHCSSDPLENNTKEINSLHIRKEFVGNEDGDVKDLSIGETSPSKSCGGSSDNPHVTG
ncbi:hypothetical protein FE257_000703 [Aspergillus nanangensis]|uniref:DAGKc domain-containing protein n=1 Tax=Aspergillus nanangensis TaxID=2582783 RepID=A0AAD4CEP7_ASPNN|nr:hypothetical protein FE257_000703 [Aspergillus nanangensis]